MQTAGGDVNCRVSHWGFTSLCISGWNKTLGFPLFLSGLMRFLLVGAFFIPEWAWQPPSPEALPLGMPSCSRAPESTLSTAQAVKSPIWLSDGCLLKCRSTCWRDGCMARNFLLSLTVETIASGAQNTSSCKCDSHTITVWRWAISHFYYNRGISLICLA